MKLRTFVTACALAFAPAPALVAQEAGTAMAAPVTDPASFAGMAASSNMFEIESSRLALEQSEDAEVQAFAQKMIDDHTAAGEKMKAAADAAQLQVPERMNDEDQQALADLQGTGDFDQAYLDAQRAAHEKAVALFQGFSENAEDGPMQDFAEETLPTLQEHLEHVQGLTGA